MPTGYPKGEYIKVDILLNDDPNAAALFERPKSPPNRGTGPSMKSVMKQQLNGMSVGQIKSQTFAEKRSAQSVQSVVHGINAATRKNGGLSIYACTKELMPDGRCKLAIKRIR